jgi:phenylacetate-coenzyme A ligase PaaK-like adenylate-forming protein
MKPNLNHASWAELPAEDLAKRQIAALRHYLKHRVLPFSEHYRTLFKQTGLSADAFHTPADLARLPLTSKVDLIPNPREFALIPDPAVLRRQMSTVLSALRNGPSAAKEQLEREFRPILMTSTTGRSSSPVPFLYTAHDLDILTEAGRRMMEIGGTNREWRHLNMFPYAPHLAFWQAHYCSVGYGAFMVGSGGGKTMGTDGNIALMEKVKPEVIIGMPTFLYHVLSQAVVEDRHWPQLRLLVLGGEKVPLGMRRKLRSLAAELGAGKVGIVATYAFTEAKMAWIECPVPAGEVPSGYHLSPDLGIMEIVDPATGKPRGMGQPGEIVYTPLDARGTVVLRYRTGDCIDGGLVHGKCPHCGRTGLRLVGNISRVSEIRQLRLEKLKGTLVDFNALEHVLDNIDGVGAWQIELRKVNDDPFDQDQVVVHVSSNAGVNRAELAHLIQSRFYETAELRPNRIDWHDNDAMSVLHGVGRALKEEKLVDHRPAASADITNPNRGTAALSK